VSTFYELVKRRQATADTQLQRQLDSDSFVPPFKATQPAPAQEEPALLHYLRILFRRRWMVLGSTCALGLLAAGLSLMMTPRYGTSARISVGRQDSTGLGFKDARQNYDEAQYSAELNAQVRILKSDSLVLENLKRLGLANPPESVDSSLGEIPALKLSKQEVKQLRFFQNGLVVSRVGQTPLIDITFSGPDPNLAARFVNGLVMTYREHTFRARYEATMHVSDFLAKQLQDLKIKFETSQQKLVEYERAKGFLGFNDKENIVTQKLDQVNHDLSVAESDRIQKQALYERSLSANPELVPEIGDNANIRHLQDQVHDLKNQYAQATGVMGSAHPKVIQLSNQLTQAEASLRDEIDKIAERDRNAYLIARSREDMLRSMLAEQKQQSNRMHEDAIEYGILKHDVESNQQLYEGLLQKLKEAGVFAGLNSSQISIVDSARVPNSPISPNLQLNIALGLLAGCFLGCVSAFLLQHLDNTIRTPDEIGAMVTLPWVATVPAMSSNVRNRDALRVAPTEAEETAPGLLASLQPASEFSESYRSLRTSILLGSRPAKVILVTSPLSKEGKSTTSLNLAAVLTQAHKRVVLVDADLRAPSLHSLLNVSNDDGLSTILDPTSQVDPSEYVVQSTRVPGLSFLPAGPVPELNAELLGSDAMKRLLGALRARFDFVVIDSAPVLATTDSVIIASQADAVVLTVRSGQTTKDALVRAHDLLHMVGAKIVGVVVNAVPSEDFGCPRYRYYGYGRGETSVRHNMGE
jgi:capsular exopolysaccharide synthesis family protein